MQQSFMNQLPNPLGLGMAQPTVEVIKCIFVATGTYQTLVHRPYNGTVTPEGIGLFQEQTNGGKLVNVSTLAGISGHYLSPVTAPQGNVNIANGFNNQRVRFFLLIRVTRPASIPTYQAITGWTDVMGLDFNTQTISPEMRLNFNSVMAVSQLADGSFVMSDNSQLIYNMPAYAPSLTGFEAARINTLLPEDVMNFIGFNAIGNVDAANGQDARGQSGSSPLIKSGRSNNLTTTYLDRSINALNNSMNAPDLNGIASTMWDIATHARADVAENRLRSDIFLEMIRANSDYDATGSIQYGNLCMILPTLNQVVDVVDNRRDNSLQATNFGSINAGNFSDWHNQRPETVFATRLIQTIPAIMMDLCISRGHLQLTNLTNDGSEVSMSFDAIDTLIPGLDLNNPLQRLQQRLKTEVLRDISMNNVIRYSLIVNTNVFGDTFIKVSLNGQPPIDYCMPSFCDSSAVPTVAPNTMAIASVAQTISLLTQQY